MSNVFRFEFKNNVIQTFIWSIIIVLFVVIYGTFFEYFADQGETLLANIPDAFSALVNLTPETFNSYEGFYSFTLTYINIIACIYFAIVGYNLFNREYTNQISEYIFTKPISRFKLYKAKLITSLVIWIIFALVFTLGSFAAAYLHSSDIDFASIMILNCIVYLNTAFFLMLSILISSFNLKIRFSTVLALPLVFAFFFISFFNQLLDIEWLKYLSPFALFNAQSVLTDGFNITEVIYVIIVIGIVKVLSIIVFTRKEVK